MTQERKPHVHAELIKAWADGAFIQYFDPVGWRDTPDNRPSWVEGVKYRIKLEEKTPAQIYWEAAYPSHFPFPGNDQMRSSVVRGLDAVVAHVRSQK